MKRFLPILTFLILTNFSAFGQKLDKEYIDSWISNTFVNAAIDSTTLYVLNGVPIEPNFLEQELIKYETNDLVVIEFIDKETIDSLRIFQPRTGIALLITIGNQSRKNIAKTFTRAKQRFKKREIKFKDIDTGLGEPVLIINGRQIYHLDSFEKINSIKPRRITGINFIEKPVSLEMYGENAMNGLIIITTK